MEGTPRAVWWFLEVREVKAPHYAGKAMVKNRD